MSKGLYSVVRFAIQCSTRRVPFAGNLRYHVSKKTIRDNYKNAAHCTCLHTARQSTSDHALHFECAFYKSHPFRFRLRFFSFQHLHGETWKWNKIHNIKENISQSMQIRINVQRSVSYTHLDVYKRQVHCKCNLGQWPGGVVQ